MPEREDGAPFIARCTYQQPYRGGAWQCRLTDPHEGVDHDLPVDAEFGRDLDTADPLWLAAKLRDQVAKTRHAQRRPAELLEQLAVHYDLEGPGRLTPAPKIATKLRAVAAAEARRG